jgi:hypothetical protein
MVATVDPGAAMARRAVVKPKEVPSSRMVFGCRCLTRLKCNRLNFFLWEDDAAMDDIFRSLAMLPPGPAP